MKGCVPILPVKHVQYDENETGGTLEILHSTEEEKGNNANKQEMGSTRQELGSDPSLFL